MLISIIIPCYNVAKYIEECLHSIFKNANLEITEIIFVDDGSTDETSSILYKTIKPHPSIKIIEKENGGLSSARNAGLKQATGKYIGFLDGDDRVTDDYWKKLYPLITAKNEVDIIEFDAVRFNSNECDRKTVYQKYFKSISSNKFSKTKVFKYAHMMVWSRIFNSTIIKDIHFPEGRKYEDQLFTLSSYVKANNIVSVPIPLYQYRYNPDSITAKRDTSNINDFLFIIEECINKLKISDSKNQILYVLLIARVWRALLTLYLEHPNIELKLKLIETEKFIKQSGYIFHCPQPELIMIISGFNLTSNLIRIIKKYK